MRRPRQPRRSASRTPRSAASPCHNNPTAAQASRASPWLAWRSGSGARKAQGAAAPFTRKSCCLLSTDVAPGAVINAMWHPAVEPWNGQAAAAAAAAAAVTAAAAIAAASRCCNPPWHCAGAAPEQPLLYATARSTPPLHRTRCSPASSTRQAVYSRKLTAHTAACILTSAGSCLLFARADNIIMPRLSAMRVLASTSRDYRHGCRRPAPAPAN